MSIWIKILIPMLFLAASSGWAGTMERHVGLITAIDDTHITIDELGPWKGPETQPKRQTFQLTETTRIARAERTREGHDGWPWSYSERWIQRTNLQAGDFVTVTIDRHGENAVAVSVLAVRPGSTADSPGSS